ncbi:43855_t:CDS:1, partial [Gigaspora margarita]
MNRRVGNRIPLKQVRSLRNRKEDTRVVIKKPSLELIDRIVKG